MARLNGTAQKKKQEVRDGIMSRAKAECEFSDRLYDILLAFQERYYDSERKPLREGERIGDLNLELSRLYNQIWLEAVNLDGKKPKKKQKQMEVIA